MLTKEEMLARPEIKEFLEEAVRRDLDNFNTFFVIDGVNYMVSAYIGHGKDAGKRGFKFRAMK